MKLFSLILVTALLTFIPQSYSANIAKNICDYVAVDDKGRLRKLLKSNRLKLRKVFNDVSCDSNNILIFAAKQNANEIGQLLIKKLPKGVIKKELESLIELSPQLAEVAKVRIK
jgi:hypothetical protein